ncbi:MAG: extracellular solute-binding protein [Clostridia bacterium]|nr:extracellular solute-binding protein [Clostridia bacterium]
MKMSKILSLVLAVMMLVTCLVACKPKTPENPNEDLKGTYDITMWVSEKDGVADQFKQQIAAFMEANPGIVINVQVEGVTEADAGSKVIADVASAPDIYCFAQDQLARLVQAAALLKPGKAAAAAIAEANDAGSVTAAKVAGELQAYPLTSDNGYFMYYDKSVLSEEDVKDLATIVAKSEAANKKVRYALENAWYTASFFFATGCHHNWTTDENGEFVSVDDTFNSDAGMIAMKGMQILTKSTAYDSNADIFTDAAVVVSGTWAAEDAKSYFGDNMGVTKLPSFTVEGKTYQLASYSGYKLMGVKPQNDPKKGAVLSLLAQYLTNAENQLARFNEFGWGPSNKEAQANEAVQANVVLTALAAQNQFATPQGQIAGVFWDNAKLLGAVAKNATTDADLKKGLDDYTAALAAFTKLTPEQRRSYTVIGGIKDSNWGTDFLMKEEPAGTWISVEAFDLAAGTEFKVRKGMSWDVAFGDNASNADASVGTNNKANFKVETAGKYYIKMVLNADETSAVIELVPAE